MAFGALIAAYAVLELVLLVLSLVKVGVGLLPSVLGFSDHWAGVSYGYYTTDVPLTLLLIGCAVAAFMGRGWARIAGMPLMAVFGYTAFTSILVQLTAGDQHGVFTQGSNIPFNLVAVLELLVSLAALVVGGLGLRGSDTAARMSGPYGGPGPYGGQPVPPAPLPQQPGAPMQPPYTPTQFAPPQGQPQQPMQQPMPQQPPQPPQPQDGQSYGYGYPQPPAQPPTAQ
ncbi:hypothetical protein [Streptacidiphilus sp. EB129]|uniref:hypothetical protein n=1 Tax=Streptacidiphilus sp. EB129 TaxID=3156262 RepID=UPI003515A2D1